MLEVKNVFKKYGKKQVLNGVEFSVSNGEIKGLIGVNGAGKSTLIDIICGVKKLDEGKIYIDEIESTNKKNKNKIDRIIGYMPQSFNMFNDLSVEENLGYLASVYGLGKGAVERTIKLCHLEDFRKILAVNLSGGYKQLLSMAGAIVHSPKFLILDEPTSAMDPIFRRKFWDIVHICKKNNVTVLVITHYMEELLECDSFVCLSGGKISFDGNLKSLNNKPLNNIEKVLKEFQ